MTSARTVDLHVDPAWLDYNGHVTDAAYAVIASRANEELLEALDLGRTYRARTGSACFTARQLIEHRGEIAPGASVTVASRVTRVGRTSLTVAATMSVDSDVRAEAEHVYVHVDAHGTPTELTREHRDAAEQWFTPR